MTRKIIFIPFFVLLFQVLHAQTDQFVRDFLLRWENAKNYSQAIAEKMPPEFYSFKPAETEMSYAGQLIHMGKNILMLCKNYLPPADQAVPALDNNPDSISKQQVCKFLEECFDYGKSCVQALSADQLEETVSFFAGPLSRRRVVMLLNDHQAHHRGQLIVYLRLKGVEPPPYVGW